MLDGVRRVYMAKLDIKVPDAAMEKLSKEIMRQWLENSENIAKEIVPVRTGKLRESIKAEKTTKNKGKIEAKTDYSVFVELGTSKQRAQPYLRPAVKKGSRKIKIK
jgi:HK97 gp10 family phage protein